MGAASAEVAAGNGEWASSSPASAPWPGRCLDTALVVLLSPLLALLAFALAAAVFVDSPGPVIYRSRRVGRDGGAFEMLKFRKMRREAHSDPLTLDDDARFTPIGRFLSATRLDELPQVVNVLRGEMRLVGPRPELELFVAEYPVEYREILRVTPGLTGQAQLRFVDERRRLTGPDPERHYTGTLMPEKLAIDLAYVRGHGVGGDLWILARTVALPAKLVIARLRGHPGLVRHWSATAACAVLVAAAFVVAVSHVP